MKTSTDMSRSLILAVAAGLTGALVNAVLASLGVSSAGASVPLFIGLSTIVGTTHYWKTHTARSMQDEFRHVRNRLALLGNGIRETQGLVQLSGLEHPYPMPFGGSWALTPDAAAILAREVAIRRPGVIVELGSGVSTVMVGRLLQQLGAGKLISLDHDTDWAAETRRHIAASGLQDFVEVYDAPLRRQEFDGREYEWYTLPDQLGDIEQIDMITVDGPPQSADTGILSRYPALPAFAGKLSARAVIYIDDARRDTEKAMVERWLENYPGWKSRMIETIPGTCLLEKQA